MEFLKLHSDSNVMRVLGLPYQYYSHPKYSSFFSLSHEQKLQCSILHGECSLCNEGDRVIPRWIIHVLSRRDQRLYLLDVGHSIFASLRKLYKSPQWGDLENYDINICQANSLFPEMNIYPLPPKPLSNFDRKLKKDFMNIDATKNLVMPPKKLHSYTLNKSYKPEGDYYDNF